MKKYVVTGASGLIGSNLLREFNSEARIFAVCRKSPLKGKTPRNVKHLAFDFRKEFDLKLMPANVDGVIHLAQSEHYREFPEHAVEVFRVNTISTLRLLDWAKQTGVRTFVFASSGGVYGGGDKEFSEEQEAMPKGDLGFYLGTKLCSEVIAQNYTPYMNVIILRFFFVYGPGQRRSMLIPRLVNSVREEKPILLQGKDGIRLNPTYVSDAVEAICGALQLTGSQKINVGGPQVLSLREIGLTIGEALKKKPKFKVIQDVEPPHLIGDIRKLSKLLREPRVLFKEGIVRYLENEST
jgi:nucleoside-diphosphate-sugar epimerase